MENLYEDIRGREDGPYFRLLRLLPSDQAHDPVMCQIEAFSITQHPEYEALSYCWGDINHQRPVTCNGQPLMVSENLESAMRKLRHHSIYRTLWIDAICINQDDTLERSHQVNIMCDIFRKATRTIAWLGLAYENSNLVFPLCERMVAHRLGFLQSIAESNFNLGKVMDLILGSGKKRRIRKLLAEQRLREKNQGKSCDDHGYVVTNKNQFQSPREGPSNDVDSATEKLQLSGGIKVDGSLHSNLSDSDPTDEEVTAFWRLLKRPWWSRIWVVQEFCVATEVTLVCGNYSIDWKILFAGCLLALFFGPQNIPDNSKTFPAIISSIAMMIGRKDLLENPATFNLLELLWTFRSFGATDPRDKVYSLLGLIPETDMNQLEIRPDYTLTIAECYRQAAVAILSMKEDLDFLATDRAMFSKLGEEMPSWVPNWSYFDRSVFHLPLEAWELEGEGEGEGEDSRPIQRSFSASGSCDKYKVSVKDRNILLLSGLITDRLVRVGEVLRVPDDPPETMEFSMSSIKSFLKIFETLLGGLGSYFETLFQWEALALSSSTYPTGEDPMKVFCATLSVLNMPDGIDATFAKFLRWKEMLTGPKKLAHLKIFAMRKLPRLHRPAMGISGMLTGWRNQSDKTFSALTEYTVSRRLARTEKGFLALVPGQSKVGDCVALFRGGKAPFVVRSQGSQWELVGCSYVHGIMHGEAWQEDNCQEFEII